MTDIQIENQAIVKRIEQLQTSSPSFDNDEIYLDNSGEVLKPATDSSRSQKTVSIEEDEYQEGKSKTSTHLDKNDVTPNTTSTSKRLKEETSKSLAVSPPIIDLTDYEEDKVDGEKSKEAYQGTDEGQANEKMVDYTETSEPKNPNEPSQKSKRKSMGASSTKRKSKGKSLKSDEASGSKEKSPKKKLLKKRSEKQAQSADESSKTPSETKSSPADKDSEVPSKSKSSLPVPVEPTKKQNDVKGSTPYKKDSSAPDDFKKRKEAKEKRADELRNYLGTVGDTLMVEPRSDDSVSYLTIPQTLEADSDHPGDLNKLPKSQVPPRTVNPMIQMGDDGECEPDRRISYDLEALMSHQVPPVPRHSKWEVVSVITDDIETVLGENENAEVVTLQNHGIKLGHKSRGTELEQPSKNATAVDCKTASRTTVASIIEDLQSLMIRKPISASAIFVFLVAALVFLGIALMQ